MNSLSSLPIETIFEVADAYKLSHWNVLPEGTTHVFSNFTPRTSRVPQIDKVMVFGVNYVVQEMHDMFEEFFFEKTEEEAVTGYMRWWNSYFGTNPIDENIQRVRQLHELGYLPLEILALQEGTYCPIGVPFWTITNTHEDFPWLVNFVETMVSAMLWDLVTEATISAEYKKTFVRYAKLTSDDEWFPDFQGHDFSLRGMRGVYTGAISGMAWLVNSKGSDSMPAVSAIKKYYPPVDILTLIATSVPATEHSLQSAYIYKNPNTFDSDLAYLDATLEAYPTGIVSMVSDGFDFWRLVTEILPLRKDIILRRDGKLVVRPDSSPKTPVEILIGDPEATTEWERKGLIEVLWDIFGGTINSKGFKVLDPHIGAIYGDSITLEYQNKILGGLMDKGFASTNVVLGVGSFSLQYFTRDTFGMAIKATAMVINGEVVPIYKDPKTDNGTKKSARGYLDVRHTEFGSLELIQDVASYYEVGTHDKSALLVCYYNGEMLNRYSWEEITENAKRSIDETVWQ